MSPCHRLTVRLFGTLEVTVDGRPLGPLRSRTVQWVFALLVLRHGREVDRSWLAGLLWPESSHEQALGNLRQSLTNLRGVLGDEAGRLQSPTLRSLRLDLTGADVDVLRFDALAAQSDSAALRAAVELYRGPLLVDCREEWVPQEREQRTRAYVAALETLAEWAARDGDQPQYAELCRRLVEADPLRESRYRTLMQARVATGDYAGALAVYRELRERLHRELSTRPSPESDALFERIRIEARARAGHRTAAPSPAGGPAAGRLPRSLTALVGRQREREEIRALVEQSRLVTLAGPGGIGKTRLALAVAEELAPGFADGVRFVDLAPVTDAQRACHALARALDLRERPAGPLEEVVREYLRPRRLLLVLDNCEHVLDACARLTESLLAWCPELRLVTTSRQPLGLAGERVVRIPSLPLPPAGGPHGGPPPGSPPAAGGFLTPAALLTYASVRLFVDRAAAAASHFRLDEANAAAVSHLCRQLDGIPLAIELAASRTRSLSPAAIAERLDDRFHLLVGGSRTALPRQQTLDAAVGWSYDLLAEADRRALRFLSVFAEGWALAAAEALLGDAAIPEVLPEASAEGWAALERIGQLSEKSLVIAEELPSGEELRYRMLETIRQYGLARLRECGEEAAARERHAEWFVALARRAQPELVGPQQLEWLHRLSAELENFRHALRWCATHGNPERYLRLAVALTRFWTWIGHSREGRQHLTAALEYLPAAPSELGATAWSCLATLAWFHSDFAGAQRLRALALDLAGGGRPERGRLRPAQPRSYQHPAGRSARRPGLLPAQPGDLPRAG